MLVLSRKAGERILIGDEIAITIVRIGPNTVKVGVDAPRGLSILRAEIVGRSNRDSGSGGEHVNGSDGSAGAVSGPCEDPGSLAGAGRSD
jgi:carbon storage regulator